MKKLSDLNPHPGNPRKITDEALLKLKKSLTEFGDLSGIIYNRTTNRLIGGHQRLKVLPPDIDIQIEDGANHGHFFLGNDKFEVRFVDWDETKEKAANIAANQHGGEWEYPLLCDWINDLDSKNIDMDLLGFSDEELKAMMNFAPSIEHGLTDEDAVPEPPKEPKTKLGDIYELGNHRLMCGDSTSNDCVDKLFGSQLPVKLDITFTSPPYNAGTPVRTKNKIESMYISGGDDKTEEDYLSFLNAFMAECADKTMFQVINIQMLAGNKHAITSFLNQWSDRLVDICIWDKEHAQPAAAERVLNSQFEFVLIFGKEKSSRALSLASFHGTESNVYRAKRGELNQFADIHAATFPVHLPEHFIKLLGGKSVYEPFGGSGSTLIACEKLSRKCFIMEIDPIYCEVIVSRWEQFTGKKANLLPK